MHNSAGFGGSGGFEGFEKYERSANEGYGNSNSASEFGQATGLSRAAQRSSGRPRLSRNGSCEKFQFGSPSQEADEGEDEKREGKSRPVARQDRQPDDPQDEHHCYESEAKLKRRIYMPADYSSTDSSALSNGVQVGGAVVARGFGRFLLRRGIIFLILGGIWLAKVFCTTFFAPAYVNADRAGRAYLASKMYGQALKEFDQGLACKDCPPVTQAKLHADMGLAYNAMQQYTLAVKETDRALRVVPMLSDSDSVETREINLATKALIHAVKARAFIGLENQADGEDEKQQASDLLSEARALKAGH